MIAAASALPLLNGSVAIGVGVAVLFFPESMFGRYGIVDAASQDLLSELRAPGALLLGAGAVMLTSAWKRSLRRLACLLASLVYGSYALGRVVSWMIDGTPSGLLLAATTVEVLLALMSLFALQRQAPGTPVAARGTWA